MNRFVTTLVPAVVLAAAAAAYAHVVDPIAQPAEDEPLSLDVAPRGLPERFQSQVAEHLADADWTEHPTWQVERADGTILMFDGYEVDEDDPRLVRLRPFALLHRSDAEGREAPYVARCEAARLQFEREFGVIFKGGDPGRIVGGSMEGEVVIRGPQSLRLLGHTFAINDESLYSDHPVAFSFGDLPPRDDERAADGEPPSDDRPGDDRPGVRVDGRADKVAITFHTAKAPDESLLSRDLPRIAGFKSIWLRRNVELTARRGRDPDDPESRPEAIALASDGRLEYLVDERVLRIEDNVRMLHPTAESLAAWPATGIVSVEAAGEGDRLSNCSRLSLVLQPDPETPEAARELLGNLLLDVRPALVRAIGAPLQPLLVRAVESEAAVQTRELVYDLLDRTVTLKGGDEEPPAGQPRPLEVRLQQPGRELYCHNLHAQLDDENELQHVRCEGTGIFRATRLDESAGDERLPNVGTERVKARWTDSLTLTPQPGGDQRLEVAGRVHLEESARDIAVAAGTLTAWIGGETATTADRQNRPNEGLTRLRRVEADGGVILATPQVHVETQTLVATVAAGSLGPRTGEGSAASLFDRESATETQRTTAADSRVFAEADRIEVGLLSDGATTELRTLLATGRVAIRHAGRSESPQDEPGNPGELGEAETPDREPQPVAISGERAMLVSQGGTKQVLTLVGAPARVDVGDIRFRSPQLTVDRAAGLITAPSGSATVPVETTLAGESAAPQEARDRGQPLEIDWADSMRFDGRHITLLRDVRAKQGETQVDCQRLVLELNRTIDLAADRPDTEGLDYNRVLFQHDVRLTGKEWHQTELLTLRKMQAAEVEFDRETGEMTAQGRGHLWQWSRDRRSVLPQASRSSRAAANRSLRADENRWQFVHLQFDGQAQGNASDRWLRLDRRVRLLHTSVDRPLEMTDADGVFDAPEVPQDAFFLECDLLEANLVPGLATGTPPGAGSAAVRPAALDSQRLQVQTFGHVELEGRQFRAQSDRLSYDQRTGDFHLHGEGDGRATVWVQQRPGGGWDPAEARTIRLNPDRRQFKADGAEGFWAAQ